MGLNQGRVLIETLDYYARHLDGPVKMYDFGGNRTVMPIPDPAQGGTYLVSSICYLFLQGTGVINPATLPWPNQKNVNDLGNGWKFIAVEIKLGMSPQQLIVALNSAKEKLEVAHGKSLDAEGSES